MKFTELLRAAREARGKTQAEFAADVGYSAQYLCDLEHGRRQPSVAFVEAVCCRLSRGPKGRLEWHVAAAEACGWKVSP